MSPIVDMARNMIHAQSLQLGFRAEVVNNAVHILNRCLTSVSKGNDAPPSMKWEQAICVTFEGIWLHSICQDP
jgi:hypothetical protein